jgi:hypothetical protein
MGMIRACPKCRGVSGGRFCANCDTHNPKLFQVKLHHILIGFAGLIAFYGLVAGVKTMTHESDSSGDSSMLLEEILEAPHVARRIDEQIALSAWDEVRMRPVRGARISTLHRRRASPELLALRLADIARIADGVLTEHWDVLQDEATGALMATRRGYPLYVSPLTQRVVPLRNRHIEPESNRLSLAFSSPRP